MDTEVIIESKSGGNSERRMTLEEISEIIGISRTTIYKVIRNKGVVSDKTREKVEQALEKYHYVENKNARNLAMNRQYTIGYVGARHIFHRRCAKVLTVQSVNSEMTA